MIKCSLLVHFDVCEEGEGACFDQRLIQVELPSREALSLLLTLLADGENPNPCYIDELVEDPEDVKAAVLLHAELCEWPVVQARVMQILAWDL